MIIYIGQGVIAYAVAWSSWAGSAGVSEDASTCHDDQCSLILLLPYICYCPGGCFLLLKQKLFLHSAVVRAVQTLKCGYDSFLLMEANPWHKRSKLFHLAPLWHGGLYNRLGGFLVRHRSLFERSIYFARHAAALQKLCWLHTLFWTGKYACLMTLKPPPRQIFPLSHPSRYHLFALFTLGGKEITGGTSTTRGISLAKPATCCCYFLLMPESSCSGFYDNRKIIS